MISIVPRDRIRNGFSQQTVKESNLILLLNLIRRQMPISRAALAKSTGLSPTTVSLLIEELIANKWVKEVGSDVAAERGRKPILLELNAKRGDVVTVEILGGGFICSLYDICFHKIDNTRVYKTSYNSENIGDEICSLLATNGSDASTMLGIHVIFPGLIDLETSDLLYSAVIKPESMVNRDLISRLRERFPGTEVLISNNNTVVAYSEYLQQADGNATRLLSMNIDEGISGGVVTSESDGELSLCFPIEVGHIVIDRNGPACKCGNKGCLEAICSTVALLSEVNEKAGLDLEVTDSFGAAKNTSSMEIVARYFKQHDPQVMAVIESYVYSLCCALASVINLFTVNSIHIGGTITILGDEFRDMVNTILYERFHLLNNGDRVTVETFSNDFERIRIAAVNMSLDEIFKNS